jgi:hypothetical protein
MALYAAPLGRYAAKGKREGGFASATLGKTRGFRAF